MLPECSIWGVLNVTPDSFSDGGRFLDAKAAIAHGMQMALEGASVIDVGGASSRPKGATYGAGAGLVTVDEEIARVVPVVSALAYEELRVSIDTTRGAVARAALKAGATIVNDVSMGADPELLAAVAEHGASLVLMHSRDGGQIDATTSAYGDLVGDVVGAVAAELEVAVANARAFGVTRIWIDPGLGFAKTAEQSAMLLACLPQLREHFPRVPVLVGASRKSFLGKLAPGLDGSPAPAADRLQASVVAAEYAARCGASAVRVHDVPATRQALLVGEQLERWAQQLGRGRRD